MKIALFGATGLVGGLAAKILSEEERVTDLTLYSRRKINLSAANLTQSTIDFHELDKELKDSLTHQTVVCSMGTTMSKAGSKEDFRRIDYDYPYQIAQIARKNGCQKFILISSLGANTESSFFYSQIKGELDRDVTELGFPSLAILRPSLILGPRDEIRPLEYMAQLILGPVQKLFVGPLKIYQPISANKIAQAVAKLCCEDSRVEYQEIYESDRIEELAEGFW